VAGEPSWTTQRIEAKVKAVSFNGSDRFVALLGRYGNASNTYQLALRSSNKVQLRKAVNGTWTTLATTTFTVSTNRWYTLKFELVGTSLKGYVDGVQKVSATDSSRTTGTVGVSSYYAVGEFDDVKVSP
jgi:pectate lyase